MSYSMDGCSPTYQLDRASTCTYTGGVPPVSRAPVPVINFRSVNSDAFRVQSLESAGSHHVYISGDTPIMKVISMMVSDIFKKK